MTDELLLCVCETDGLLFCPVHHNHSGMPSRYRKLIENEDGTIEEVTIYLGKPWQGQWKAEKRPDGLFHSVPDYPSNYYPDYHPDYGNCRIEPDGIFVPADGRNIPKPMYGYDPEGWTTAYTEEEIKPQRRNSMLTKITWAVFCTKDKEIYISETEGEYEGEYARLYYGRVIVQGHPTAALQVAYDFFARCFANHSREWHIDKITFQRDQELTDSEQEIEVEAWEA